MKKATEFYSKPTPAKWRRLGDSILTAGGSLTILGTAYGMDWLAISGTVFGIVGKFVTNFFSDEK